MPVEASSIRSSLEVELHVVMSHPHGFCVLNSGSPEEQYTFLTMVLSPQPVYCLFYKAIRYDGINLVY